MRQKQFNGFNWCPFFHEVNQQVDSENLKLGDYDNLLILKIKKNTISINITSDHFLFENKNVEGAENILYDELISNKVIDEDGVLKIQQNSEGLDTEDRVEKLVECINEILESK